MKHLKQILILCLLWTMGIVANADEIPNDEIWYTASSKLPETTNVGTVLALHMTAFNTTILSHTFSDGKGVIKFNEDVTSIGEKAFYSCTDLTSINIPNSVTNIGKSAFAACSSLTSINIPNSVTSIGESAFFECSSLTSITIPDSVTNIGYRTFYGCSRLTSITIPNSVTSIGNGAFSNCSGLTSVTIPNSVKSIERDAFFWCTSLTSITIPNSVTSIGSEAFYGCSSLTSITIPNSVTSIGSFAFYGCSSLTSITIPNSVTSIGSSAFCGCSSLTSVTIPNSVTSIRQSAFSGCHFVQSEFINNSSLNEVSNNYWGATICDVIQDDGLCIKDSIAVGHRGKPTSITIPNSVTSIGESAFYYCSGLTSITIPNSVTSIGNHAFSSCTGLTSVTVGNSVTSIGGSAFYGCSGLKYIFCLGATPATLGNQYTIENGTVYVPAGAKSAYSSANYWRNRTVREGFVDDGLILQLVDNSYFTVDGYIDDTGVTDVLTIPSSAEFCGKTYNITNISSYAFDGNITLTNVVMPNSIEAIGTYAFSGCSNLKSVTLSKNITTLSDYAFQNCTSLESIAIPAGTITIESYVFDGCTSLSTVTMKDYVTSIGQYCFRGCESLKSITLSSKITTIPSYAFQNCRLLPSVSLSGIVSVGGFAYDGCTSIPEVSIPANCTSIATTAFNGCTALKAFTVDASNTAYGTIDGVLTNKGQTQIVAYPSAKGSTYDIPATIISIGDYAFRGSELTSISIPSTVSTIYNYAFANCKKLSKAVFENSTNTLSVRNYIFQDDSIESVEIYRVLSPYNSGAYTPFYNLTSLKSVVLGDGITNIYASMFYGCSSLNSVTMNDAVTSIGSSAFYNCSSLPSIKIPATVTSIGDAFLSGCSGLKEINAKMQTPPTLQSTAFTGVDKDACKLIVPADYVETYGETPGWMAFNNIVAEDDASLRKITLSLTDGGTVTIDSRTYDCEGTHSFYVPSTADAKVVITPNVGYYLKNVKLNDTDIIRQMDADTLILTKTKTEATLAIAFAPCAETTDLSEYDYALYFNDMEARSGTNATLQLNLKNKAEDVTAFECKVNLPENVTWATTTDKRGNVILVQPTFNTTTERTDASYHTISNVKQVSDGSYYIIVYSDKKEYIMDNDGAVLDIPVVLSEDIEAGDYNIILKSIVITKTNTTDVKIDRIVSRLTVPSYVLGDANGDTFINVSDIVTIISYMMEENPDPFIFAAADVNADTYVNVTDVVGVIDIMMDNANAAKPRAAAKKTSKASTTSGSDYLLKVAPLTVAKDATSLGATLDLINAQEDITAFECKVYLPAGIEWTSTTDKRGNVNLTQPTFNATTERTDASYHTISAVKQMADGGYYVIVYSNKKEYILGNSGAVLDLPLKLAEDVADGVYDIKVDGMVITHTNGTDVKPSAYTTSIIVGNPTEIALKGDLDASTLSVYEPAWKNNSKVTSLDVSAATGIAEETNFSMANPNALLFVSEGTSVSNTDNVVKGSTCAQLTLTDGYNFKAPKAFTATKATYSRDVTGYGTICLPYTPSTDGFKYYELAEDDGTALKFTKVETLQANTPYIYTKTGSDTAITGSGVEISADGAGEADMEGDNWKMIGTYESVTLTYPTDDIYALSGGVLYHNTGNLTMKPFRAYFKKENGPTVKSVNIIIEDETTGIVDVDVDADVDSVMFNTAGQKVADGYKGIVIKNGKKFLQK